MKTMRTENVGLGVSTFRALRMVGVLLSASSALSALSVTSALTVLSAAPAHAQDVATIKPGMSQADVRANWGEPLTVKSKGDYSYMFYQNGCLKTCGTYDVVILEKDQVVDAIVRAKNRRYDGTSSSPSDRAPEPTGVVPGT